MDLLFDIVQQALNGLMYGSSYALIALGFTLMWGVMRRVNLAYGPTAIVGAYIGLWASSTLEAPILLVFVASVLGSVAMGVFVELFSFRLLKGAPERAHLMSTIGMLILLEEAIVRVTAAMPFSFPNPLELTSVHLGPFYLRGDLLALLGAGLFSTLAFSFLVYRTRFGRAVRAVSENIPAARLLGVSVARISSFTFIATSALGGGTGFFVAMVIGALKPDLGSIITIKGLVAMVLGGFGSIPGAVLGGLLLGVVEFQAMWFLGVGYRDLFAYLLLFAFLVFRPSGLLGEEPAKV